MSTSSSVSSLLNSTIASPTPTPTSTTAANPYSSLKPADFVSLMITQLQNQDPTDPTSNQEILQQISEIGQLQSSSDLSTSLQGMVLQNNIGAASNLIGKSVQGLDATGAPLAGTVNSVNVQSNQVLLQLDSGKSLSLSNITNIAAATATTTAGTTTPSTGTATTTTTG